jgi:Cu+-exporting ATPase
LLAFADPVRPGAAQVVESLSRMGLATYVLSSEAAGTVRALAAQTGIPPENICAGVRPAERAARLRAIREQAGATVAVGHGIKDAELLSSADVGVAIGGGAEVAVDCTAVALIGGDLHGVRRVLRLARGMVRTARVNLAASVAFALAGLPLAAVLVPDPSWLAAWLRSVGLNKAAWLVPDQFSPIQVTLVMVLVALAVALNSYRLARSSSEKD